MYTYAAELWKQKYVGLAKGNEETTKREFLEKVFEKLGFHNLPTPRLPASKQRRVPDYLLYQSEEEKDKVFNSDLLEQYRAAICLLEAKKVNHPLDAVSKKETPGRFPHQQVRDYLNEATDQLGNPFFKWAILSNGGTWRLYNRDSHPSAYFEFRLAAENHFCDYEDFKVFVALFRPEAFIATDGICSLDEIRSEAIQTQVALEEKLRKRIFTVIEDLANGFWSNKGNKLASDELTELYDNCLIFLYRLLFVLYAESRGLLPVKPYGAGSNKNYITRYSLQRLVRILKLDEYQSDEFTELYEQLLDLFHLINGDTPSRNKACNVPRYNGGLFDPKRYPKLENWRIGEKSLAKVLKDLIFSPAVSKGQQEFDWGTIDYADLEVRQLGDIYEGLLGGSLTLQGDSLALSEEYKKNKSTGTYYTPDFIVMYIVKKTLTPLIEKIEAREDIGKSLEKERKDNSFANAVLQLNVLDPALGSGHFLVRATEWLADKIIDHATTEYQVKDVSPGLSQEQAERSYWRRRVVEACIYGVDVNPLAVELSKLSLWLTSIAPNEPLNFLDHHLRAGNSLTGASIGDMAMLPKKEKFQQSLSFGPDLASAVSSAIRTIEVIEAEASTSLETVKKKEAVWRTEVIDRLAAFKTIGDIWTAALSGLDIGDPVYHKLANYLIHKPEKNSKEQKDYKEEWGKIEKDLEDVTSRINPLHWELEFPDVFFEQDGSKKDNPGFDAVIGNPPYVRHESIKAFKPQLAKVFGGFYCGTADLYTYFYKKGIDLLRKGGHLCFIAPNKFMRAGYGKNTRTLLTTEATPQVVIDFCDLPIFDATTYPAVLLVEKRRPTDKDKTLAATFATEEQLGRVEETLSSIGFKMPVASLRPEGWNLERHEVLALMEKLRKAGKPLGEYVNGRFYYGIKTGLNEAFVIDAATRKRLISEDPKSKELIKPWLRGRDIKKWKSEWAGLYVIFTRHGTDINKYPAIKGHLEQFKEDLKPKTSDEQKRGRKPGPYKWYEIQDNIAYYKEFEGPKIVWGNMATSPKFAFDKDDYYISAPANLLPASDTYLVGLLNSSICNWLIAFLAAVRGGNFLEFKPMYVEQVPVYPATEREKAKIIERVEKILSNPDGADVPRLEAEIDKLVYALYGLTPEEIEIVEGRNANK